LEMGLPMRFHTAWAESSHVGRMNLPFENHVPQKSPLTVTGSVGFY